MCFKRIHIKTGTQFPEGLDADFVHQITKEFTMFVTPFTTNKCMLRKAHDVCNSEDACRTLEDRFQVVVNDGLYRLDGAGKLNKLICFLGNPPTLYLDYAIGLPGGFGLDERNGIYYFLHTKELRHVPHVHARYQGKEISVELLTDNVKGTFKNRKKQKEAIAYVKANSEEFLRKYNMKTNGIHIPGEYIQESI